MQPLWSPDAVALVVVLLAPPAWALRAASDGCRCRLPWSRPARLEARRRSRCRRRRIARRRGGGRAPRKGQGRSRSRRETAARWISVRFRPRAKQPSRATFRALASARHENPRKPFVLESRPLPCSTGYLPRPKGMGGSSELSCKIKGTKGARPGGSRRTWHVETRTTNWLISELGARDHMSARKAYHLFVAHPKVLRPKTGKFSARAVSSTRWRSDHQGCAPSRSPLYRRLIPHAVGQEPSWLDPVAR